MRKRLFFLIILALIMMFIQGCSYGRNQTGLGYILKEAAKLRSYHTYYVKEYVKEPEVAGAGETRQDDSSNRNSNDSIPGQKKKVYLTFDDGPDSLITPLILDILDGYGAKATFFVVGTNVEKNPEILRDIVKRGHAVGNHTYNHRYSDVYSGGDGFLRSIRLNDELIFQTIGQRTRVVRDPGGEVRKSESLKRLLAHNGYQLIDWNVDSHDSRVPSPSAPEIIENIRRQIMQEHLWPGVIILMHDGPGHMNTVRALPTVLDMLVNQGFQFEVLK